MPANPLNLEQFVDLTPALGVYYFSKLSIWAFLKPQFRKCGEALVPNLPVKRSFFGWEHGWEESTRYRKHTQRKQPSRKP